MKKSYKIVMLVLLIVLTFACVKEYIESKFPVVTTLEATSILTESATLGGNVSFIGSGAKAIKMRGIVYNTSGSPSLGATGVKSLEAIEHKEGDYKLAVFSLLPNTTYYVRAYVVCADNDAVYAKEVSFLTASETSVVTTSASVLNLGTTSAIVSGQVTSLGSGTKLVVKRGIVYSTIAASVIDGPDAKNIDSSMAVLGQYSISLKDLSAATKYYFKAYTIGADKEIQYGAEQNFTTLAEATPVSPIVVSSSLPASIGTNSAIVGGDITNIGTGSKILIKRGAVYGLIANPVIDGLGVKNIEASIAILGDYSISLTNLSNSTLYHFRAYAIAADNSIIYGSDVIFTTLAPTPAVAPIVTTSAASNIDLTSAILAGNVTGVGTGTKAMIKRGIVYSFSVNPTVDGYGVTTIESLVAQSGVYSISLSGLVSGQTYNARAYVLAADNVPEYGANISFTTSSASVPIIATISPASNIASTSANVGGNITSLGTGSKVVVKRGIVYGTAAAPTVDAAEVNKIESSLATTGTYSMSLTGLAPSTAYVVRAYTISADNTITYGADVNFTSLAPTAPTTPVVTTTTPAANIASTSANVGGNVTNAGTGTLAITKRGIVYGTAAAPAVDAAGVTKIESALATTGIYSMSLTALTPSTAYVVRAYTISADNTITYGADVNFTTLAPTAPTAPVVTTTSPAASVTTTSAIVSANVTGAGTGTKAMIKRGIVYGLAAAPTVDGAGTTHIESALASTGIYSISLTGLTAGTAYTARAYVVSADNSLVYGADVSFTTTAITAAIAPVVATSTTIAISITTSSAIVGGNVTNAGTSTKAMIKRGIVYGTTAAPAVDAAGVTKVESALALAGNYSMNITGLYSSTTYYVRAYVVGADNVVTYGADDSFTTLAVVAPVAPVVTTTTPAANIASTSANVGGNVTNAGTGTLAITKRGIVYGTAAAPAVDAAGVTKIESALATTGTYSMSLTALTPSTAYVVRAYTISADNTITYGADVNFTSLAPTAPTAPVVTTTSPAASVTTTSAIVSANVTGAGTGTKAMIKRGIVYGLAAAPTVDGAGTTHIESALASTGTYSISLTGLTAGTAYTARAYVVSADNSLVYGADVSFTTTAIAAAIAPVLTTSTASSITINSATVGGNVTNAGTSTKAIIKRGIVYGTTAAPAVDAAGVTKVESALATTGTYSMSLTGLYSSTTYYVRAYVVGADNVVTYGADDSFTTLAVVAPVAPVVTTTTPAANIASTSANVGGNVTNAGTGTLAITKRGIVYGTAAAPTVDAAGVTKIESALATTGTYSMSLTALTPSTAYVVRAYTISVDNTITYGADVNFTSLAPTAPTAPVVTTTSPATSITTTSAIVDASVTNAGTGTKAMIKRGFVYGVGASPVVDGAGYTTIEASVAALGAYSTDINGLVTLTTYNVRAYAISADNTVVYGATVSFTTL